MISDLTGHATCRTCGCTEINPCIDAHDAPCRMVTDDLCSGCDQTPLPLREREGPAAKQWEGEGDMPISTIAAHPKTKVSPQIQQLLRGTCGVDVVMAQWPGTGLTDDLNLDSLDRIEIVAEIEDRFDIHITDDEAAALTTVGDIETLVTAKLRGKS